MASAPTENATDQSPPPSLEELARRSARTILLPYIVDYASSAVSPSDQPVEVAVIVNPRTGSLTVVEGSVDVEAFLSGKEGSVPASKASIDAMPVVKVVEEGLDCAICLADFEVDEEAKQMPCKHRFHAGCIDKWLGIQGSCPVCRYRMPEEEEENNNKGGGGDNNSDGEADESEEEEEEDEEGEGGIRLGRIPTFVFHIYFARRRRGRRNSESGSGEESEFDNMDRSLEVDSGSGSQEMDMEGSDL